jgi:hypothetical protein
MKTKNYIVLCDGSGNGGIAATLSIDGSLVDMMLDKIPQRIPEDFTKHSRLSNELRAEIYALALGVQLISKNVIEGHIHPLAIVLLHTDSEAVMRYLYAPHEIKSEHAEMIIKKIIAEKSRLSKIGIDINISRKQHIQPPSFQSCSVHDLAAEASRGENTETIKQKIIDEHINFLNRIRYPVFDIKHLTDSIHCDMTISESLFFDMIDSGISYAAAGKLTGRDPETVRTTVTRAKKKVAFPKD